MVSAPRLWETPHALIWFLSNVDPCVLFAPLPAPIRQREVAGMGGGTDFPLVVGKRTNNDSSFSRLPP